MIASGLLLGRPLVVRAAPRCDATGETVGVPSSGFTDPEHSVSESRQLTERNTVTVGPFSFDAGPRDGTRGYVLNEWIIRSDAMLFVHDEPSDNGGHLAVGNLKAKATCSSRRGVNPR